METITWLLGFASACDSLHQDLEVDNKNFDDIFWEILSSDYIVSHPVPLQLSALPPISIRILAHIIQQKMSGEDKLLGHEVINKLKEDAENTTAYLKALDELELTGWLELTPDSDSHMKLRPWCWLQARVEPGQCLLKGNEPKVAGPGCFSFNEEYLDCVIEYIGQLAKRLTGLGKTICSVESHNLPEWEPDSKFREIEERLKKTTIAIPAAEIRTKLKLTDWQYLYLIGVLGYSERVIQYDFSDINDVVKLFASGFNVRRMMREHLAGPDSPLVKHGMLVDSDGMFYVSSKPSAKAVRMITGRKVSIRSFEGIRSFVARETLFEIEKPRVKRDSLLLPETTMEIFRTIIHAEQPEGKKIRNILQKSMPNKSGCPTGSTILLNGPPGTGKTFAASYLASELNVPILKVDCSKVLGRYIGESEKNVRRLFDDYAVMCKMLKKRPLLLLNEADQLLGERNTPHGSADQSNNNVQNLFLEALERFDGILVATTNRKELLDKAYNRRFTYKIELNSPSLAMRQQLWESHLPDSLLDGKVDMKKLAAYPLTGGEIRLVLEQAVRSAAYHGCSKIGERLLHEIAGRETVASKGKQIRSIGFGAQA